MPTEYRGTLDRLFLWHELVKGSVTLIKRITSSGKFEQRHLKYPTVLSVIRVYVDG